MPGDYIFEKILGRFGVSSADTDGGGVTTVQAAPSGPNAANEKYSVTGIQVSGDATALVTIESPAGTVIWRKRYAAAFAVSEAFAPGTVNGAAAALVQVKISAGTTNTEANMQGFRVPA